MQVNVTGVSHLKLVFMIVLVLQSFLAVSFQVFQVQVSQVFLSFQVLPPFQVFQVQVSQAFQVVRLYFFKAPSV